MKGRNEILYHYYTSDFYNVNTLEGKIMENYAICLIIAFVSIPMIFGSIYAWITRPSKYYYKHDGLRWVRKR